MYFDNINDDDDEENDESFQEESELDEENEEKSQSRSNNKIKIKYNEEEEITDDNQSKNEKVVTDSDDDKMSGKESKDDSDQDIDNDDDRDKDMLIDDDYSEGAVDKLSELLFCVQGIGLYTDDNKLIYEKGKYCEPSMRDIHRFLRKDDPENPECRLNLLTWKTAETDIIPLILNYENNEKIQQLGLVLLVDITEVLPELVEHRPELESMLTELQEYIINSKLIELLSRSLADYTAKQREASIMRKELMLIERQEKSKEVEPDVEEATKANEIKKKIAEVENKSETMIELIFVLLKQVMNIINSNSIKANVKNNIALLRKLSTLKIFDAIVFHSQSFESEFSKRLSSTILELLFFLIRPFTAGQINNIVNDYNYNKKSNNKPQGQTMLQKLMEEEKQQKMIRQSMLSSRSNKFGTTIKIDRPMDNTSFIVSNISMLTNHKDKFLSNKINEFADQKKKPRRGMKILTKKTVASKASEEVKFVNDIKIYENFASSIDYTYGDMMISLKKFCEQFQNTCLNGLIKYFFIEIKLNEKVEKYDYYHVVSIMTFFLDFNRINEYSVISSKKESDSTFSHVFNSENIKECLTGEMIDYCYNVAYSQTFKALANERKLFELFCSIRYLKQVLLTGFDLFKYRSDSNLEKNVVIQDSLVTKDFSKIIKAIFNLHNENYHPRKLLYESIQLTEIYFTSLDLYSNKRKLKKKTKKLKPKNKEDEDEEELVKKLKEEHDNFIEKDKSDDDKENDDEHTGSVSLSEEVKEEYLERDLNVSEEMRVLLDYSIISKIFSIFNSSNSIDSNNTTKFINELKDNDIVKYSAKLFDRITKTLKEPSMFYQIEYLYIIHSLHNEPLFMRDIYFNQITKIFNEILKSFFSAVEKNKMLPIESLFRFPSHQIKASILNNYDEIQPEIKDAKYNGENQDYRNDAIAGYDGAYLPEDDEVEYDGNNIEMVKVVGESKENKKKKEKKIDSDEENSDKVVWTEKEDILLIQNYSEFSELDNFYKMLDQLFPLKSMKEIKSRIKLLKLRKGANKAMKVFTKIHKKRKQREEKLFNIIIELSDECRNENKKRKIEKTIHSLRQQLESYKVRKGLMDNSPELECVLLPNSEDEIEIMEESKFQNFIKNLGLIPPDGENFQDHKKQCWRVDPKSDTYEISIIIEKLDNFERVINENVEIEDPEYEAERRQARKEKKRKHKKDKKDKKDKKKKKKNKREEYEKRSDKESDAEPNLHEYKKSMRSERQSVDPSVISDRSENKNQARSIKYSVKQSERSNIDYRTVKNSVVDSSATKRSSYDHKNENKSNKEYNYDIDRDQDDNNNITKNSKKKKLRKGLKDDDFNFD